MKVQSLSRYQLDFSSFVMTKRPKKDKGTKENLVSFLCIKKEPFRIEFPLIKFIFTLFFHQVFFLSFAKGLIFFFRLIKILALCCFSFAVWKIFIQLKCDLSGLEIYVGPFFTIKQIIIVKVGNFLLFSFGFPFVLIKLLFWVNCVRKDVYYLILVVFFLFTISRKWENIFCAENNFR